MISLVLVDAANDSFKIDEQMVIDFIKAKDPEQQIFDAQLLKELQDDIYRGGYCGDIFLLIDHFPLDVQSKAYDLVKDAYMQQINQYQVLEKTDFQSHELKFFDLKGFKEQLFNSILFDEDEDTLCSKGLVLGCEDHIFFFKTGQYVEDTYRDIVDGIVALNKIAMEYGVSAARNCIYKENYCIVKYTLNAPNNISNKMTTLALKKYGNKYLVSDLIQVFGQGWLKSIKYSPLNQVYSDYIVEPEQLVKLEEFPHEITPNAVRNDISLIVKHHLENIEKRKLDWVK